MTAAERSTTTPELGEPRPFERTIQVLWKKSMAEIHTDFDELYLRHALGDRPVVTWPIGLQETGIYTGDRVFVRATGFDGPRGIIAAGIVVKEPYASADDRTKHFFKFEITMIVPRDQVLRLDSVEQERPAAALPEADASALEASWRAHVDSVLPESGLVDEHDYSGGERTELRFARHVVQHRLAWERFRLELLRTQPHRCAVCGLSEIAVLEPVLLHPEGTASKPNAADGPSCARTTRRRTSAGCSA